MFSTKKLTFCAIAGAMYAAMTLALAPFSFGVLQLRISEVLCVLPFLVPCSAWGLFVGCFIANLISGNIFDVIFGSLATLAAGLLTARFGRKCRTAAAANHSRQAVRCRFFGCLMPVIINAVVVGIVLTYAYEGQNGQTALALLGANMLWLGISEAGIIFLLGLPLMRLAEKNKKSSRLLWVVSR